MNVIIFGANGPTGRLLTRQAIDAGHRVTAFTRHASEFPFKDQHLRIHQGDVLEPSSMDAAVAGQDAVLSSLGVPFSRKPVTVLSSGTAHIIAAMQTHGVTRLACVSSSVMAPPHPTGGGFIFEKVLQPIIIRYAGRTLYDDMRRMEAIVMESDLDWTIVRPSGLFATPTVTSYELAESHLTARWTSRADLADVLFRQLTDPRYLRKAVAVATRSSEPKLLRFILQEAVGVKGS